VPIPAEDKSRHGRAAANSRWHSDRPELAADDRRILKAKALERQIRRALASETPPAQPERDQLALLLLRGDPA
jgi:hypothetical protein